MIELASEYWNFENFIYCLKLDSFLVRRDFLNKIGSDIN